MINDELHPLIRTELCNSNRPQNVTRNIPFSNKGTSQLFPYTERSTFSDLSGKLVTGSNHHTSAWIQGVYLIYWNYCEVIHHASKPTLSTQNNHCASFVSIQLCGVLVALTKTRQFFLEQIVSMGSSTQYGQPTQKSMTSVKSYPSGDIDFTKFLKFDLW